MSQPWNNLSATEFEEFCYHLLKFGGFKDLEWFGRGGGDKGRDITATRVEKPFSGSRVTRKWLVQCKHYKSAKLTKGLIADWLASCREHRPDRVLIITSRSLSANLKDWLQSIRHDYPFEIHAWDETHLAHEYWTHGHRLRKLFPHLPKVRETVVFYSTAPWGYHVRCSEFDEVEFFAYNCDSEREAEDKVQEFVEFIRANDIKIQKTKRRQKEA